MARRPLRGQPTRGDVSDPLQRQPESIGLAHTAEWDQRYRRHHLIQGQQCRFGSYAILYRLDAIVFASSLIAPALATPAAREFSFGARQGALSRARRHIGSI